MALTCICCEKCLFAVTDSKKVFYYIKSNTYLHSHKDSIVHKWDSWFCFRDNGFCSLLHFWTDNPVFL